MNSADKYFLELLRIAAGTQDTFSGVPDERDWQAMYDIAARQSLLGVCFAGVQSMHTVDIYDETTAEERMSYWTLPESLYLQWMAAAAKIQAKNGRMSGACTALQAEFAASGMGSCILKGQSVARYYGCIGEFRQTGDIDIWVNTDIDALVAWAEKNAYLDHVTYAHVGCVLPNRIKAELHPYPAFFRCPWLDRRLQRWVGDYDMSAFEAPDGFKVAPVSFDLVYLLVHSLNHLLVGGVGMRHYMDYYFAMKAAGGVYDNDLVPLLKRLGLLRFARGVVWIMRDVFGMPESELFVEADESVGRLLLDEALAGGNFGHYDYRDARISSENALARVWALCVRNFRFIKLAPWLVICSPFWRLWHFIWMKRRGYR